VSWSIINANVSWILHFIRMRSNLNCSFKKFPIYAIQEKQEQVQGREKERRGGEIVRTVVIVTFLKLTSRSIPGNQKNGLPYSTYIVAIISVQIVGMFLYFYSFPVFSWKIWCSGYCSSFVKIFGDLSMLCSDNAGCDMF